MDGWRRSMYWDETGLPWVMPSPNIPTLDSAIVFPGTVHIEGTTASEGRGTTRPFELVGAPWVQAEAFAAALNARGLPGVYFRAAVFEPTFQKHARVACGGCQIHVLDRQAFQPVLTGTGAHRRDARRRSGELRVEAAALRIRARQAADGRHRRLAIVSRGDRQRRARRSHRGGMARQRRRAFAALRQPFLIYA